MAMIEKTAELSTFGQCGVVASDPTMDSLAAGGGLTVNMPFWTDLTNTTRQLLNVDGTTALTVYGIASAVDIAAIQTDAQVWGSNILAGLEAGSDPMEATASLIGGYWARMDELQVIASVKGVLAAASMSGNLTDISSTSIANVTDATTLNGRTFIDALQLLGDRADRLTTVAMHSATESALRKLDLIDFIPDSEGKSVIRTFQGRRVVVDDNMPRVAGGVDGYVYTTVLFGPGAFARGQSALGGMPLKGGFGTHGLEYGRTPLASSDFLINRRRYILHPRGVKWIGTASGSSPTDVELAVGTNWERVYEAKNVRMVAIKHNNAA
jgi:hypothetical protein